MMPTFKNPLRSLLSSMASMNSLDTTPGSKAIPPTSPRLAIVIWVQMIISFLQGWTLESVAVWRVLIGYRLKKAYHCKCKSSQNEHEFVIYEFSNEQRERLELRVDRWVGKRKASPGTTSLDSEFDVSSMNSAARRLSDSSIPRPSAISSGHCLASDTIARINGHPKNCKVMKVLTFRDDRAYWPSLWDVMILIHVIHKDSTTYTLMQRQCYWFADTMFGLLEQWLTEYKNGAVIVTTQDRKKGWRLKRAQAPIGCLWSMPVHHRDDAHMLELWNKYMSERQDMNSQKEGFERRQTELLRKAQISDELAKKVAEYQERERRFMREQVEKERRLREEREEWEHQLNEEQEKRERRLREQLREEQVEKERRLREHLKDEQLKRERLLTEQFEIRFREEQELNERRFQELTNVVRSNSHLNESGPAPS